MSSLQPASTVVLARSAPASTFEVFLVRRHDNIAFMGGAHVFPGGRVDPADHLADPERWCDGWRGASERLHGRTAEDALAFHVAAARELFEEAGVLLARDVTGAFVTIGDEQGARFTEYRRAVTEGRLPLRELLRREGLRLALDALTVFAHWVTPDVELRRFDTCFFFAPAPGEQHAAHDDRELTEGTWMTPRAALESCLAGGIALPPPTWTTLRALSRCATLHDAERWARAQPVARVQPCVFVNDDGTRIVALPGDPLCAAVEGFHAEETRFVLEQGRWRPA